MQNINLKNVTRTKPKTTKIRIDKKWNREIAAVCGGVGVEVMMTLKKKLERMCETGGPDGMYVFTADSMYVFTAANV